MDFRDCTLFDIFIKKKYVYMILSINHSPIHENDIQIAIDHKYLPLVSKKLKNTRYEATLILVYKYENTMEEGDKIIANIRYKNMRASPWISKIKHAPKQILALTTLFKKDYKLFPLFYSYYKQQGVEHFYMYYNGIITPEIKKTCDYKDVTLIQWNFKYWNTIGDNPLSAEKSCIQRTGPPESHRYRHMHHAQPAQMHDAIYKYGKDQYAYMIFCDLDEYLYIKNYTLLTYILNNPEIDVFGFCNFWSNTLDNKIPTIFPEKILIGNNHKYGNKSKNIFRIAAIDTIGIHRGFTFLKRPNKITNLHMFHFYNWSHPSRIYKCFKHLTLI